ncbi:MAG: VOC family protein [Acidimicrobiia bacterium]|nr:VOC family protein [Acidimicrobiia bacterium]
MTINSLDHYNIETARLEETVEFYAEVLGLSRGYRPSSIPVPGAWMYAGGHACIHINEVSDDMAGPTGPINHVAFETANEPGDYDTMKADLAARGLPFDEADSRPMIPLRQIFVHDPNGIRLELNYRDQPLTADLEGSS